MRFRVKRRKKRGEGGLGSHLSGDAPSGGIGICARSVKSRGGGGLVEVDGAEVSICGRIRFSVVIFLVERIGGVVLGMVSLVWMVVMVRRVGVRMVLVGIWLIIDICGGWILMSVMMLVEVMRLLLVV